MEPQRNRSIFDLPWEDILVTQILQHLSLKDLFNLRSCSRCSCELVDYHLSKLKKLMLPRQNSHNIKLAFQVLVNECCSLLEVNLDKCNWLTTELLMPLLVANKKLQMVNLNDCINVTASALQPILIDCKELRSLKVARCIWVTIGAASAFTLHQSRLKELVMSHGITLDERYLVIFFHKFPLLEVLSLAYTVSVTDNVLVSISTCCKAIRHLNISGCYQVTDRGIEWVFLIYVGFVFALICSFFRCLAKNLSSLDTLMLRGCPKVSERGVSLLRGRVRIDKPHNEMGHQHWPIQQLFLQV